MRTKITYLIIASILASSFNVSFAEEEAWDKADAEFNRAVAIFNQCFSDRSALASKSDLPDSAAADFVIDACRKELADTNYWRCAGGLDGSSPLFAAIFAKESYPLKVCQDVFNERDLEDLKTLALTRIMQARYE